MIFKDGFDIFTASLQNSLIGESYHLSLVIRSGSAQTGHIKSRLLYRTTQARDQSSVEAGSCDHFRTEANW